MVKSLAATGFTNSAFTIVKAIKLASSSVGLYLNIDLEADLHIFQLQIPPEKNLISTRENFQMGNVSASLARRHACGQPLL